MCSWQCSLWSLKGNPMTTMTSGNRLWLKDIKRKELRAQVLCLPQETKCLPKAYCDWWPTGAETQSALGHERCWQHLPRMWSRRNIGIIFCYVFTRKRRDSRQCSPTSPLLSLTDTSFVCTSWVINRILFFIPLLLPLGFLYFWSQRRR